MVFVKVWDGVEEIAISSQENRFVPLCLVEYLRIAEALSTAAAQVRHFMPDLPEHIRSGLRKVFVEKESPATASYADA